MKKSVIILSSLIIVAIAALFFYVFIDNPKKIKIKNDDVAAVSVEKNDLEEVKKEEPEEAAVETNGNVTEMDNEINGNTVEINGDTTETDREIDRNVVEIKTEDKNIKIINKKVSWGYQSVSSRKIDTIIIHSSYNALGGDEYDVAKLIKEYKEYGVAPHYLINRQGNVYQLVSEKNIAYHAGTSSVPDGRVNVNNFSIGIEIMNTKTAEYTAAQYGALKSLIADIKTRYKIKYVLGHNQIAPGRKDDPWNFEWSKLE